MSACAGTNNKQKLKPKGTPFSWPMDTDDMTASPPRLPPVSGVLVTANPAVVRPVAFRAVRWGHGADVDDGCSSSGSVFNLHDERLLLAPERRPSGHHSAPLLERQPRSAAVSTRTAFHPARCKVPFHQSMPHFDCKEARAASRSSSGGGSAMLDVLDSGHSSAVLLAEEEAPSPSDSGVAELEAQLREKDAEIAHLRQTLERNEQAIIQVYEEKEQLWHRRLDDLRDHYEQQLQRHDVAAARDESPVCSGSGGLEEASCRPGGALKLSWLDTPQLDSEVAELTTLMEDSRLTGNANDDVRRLRLELHRCRRQLQVALQGFEEERQRWQHERAQAAQYQRQLETSYWQLCSHNRELLRAVSHASLPLELLDGWYHSESSC